MNLLDEYKNTLMQNTEEDENNVIDNNYTEPVVNESIYDLYQTTLSDMSTNFSDDATGRTGYLDSLNKLLQDTVEEKEEDDLTTTDTIDTMNTINPTINNNASVEDIITNAEEHMTYKGMGQKIDAGGNIVGEVDTDSNGYKFVRGFTSEIVDKYMYLAGQVDKHFVDKNINKNNESLKALGLTDEDLKSIDDAIVGNIDGSTIKLFDKGTEKEKLLISNQMQINNLLTDRRDYVARQVGINDLQEILKLKQQASDISAQDGGAEKWGQFSAGVTSMALKVSVGIASGSAMSGAMEGAAVTSTLAKVGLNTTIGREVIKLLGESVVETAGNALFVKADSELNGTDYGSAMLQEFMYNMIGNTIGDAIGVGVKKIGDFKAMQISAKHYKELSDFAGMSTEDLSAKIISNPDEVASKISEVIKKTGKTNIFSNDTLNNLIKNEDTLKIVLSQVSNTGQGKIFVDIMSGTKLSNEQLGILKDILEKSDRLDSSQVDEVLEYINAQITTDGKVVTKSTTTSLQDNLTTPKMTIEEAERMQREATESLIANKLINAPETITANDFDTFLKTQAKAAGIDIEDATAMTSFIDGFKFADGVKGVDELLAIKSMDPDKYNNIVVDFLTNKNMQIGNVKFNNQEILKEIENAKAGLKIRKMYQEPAKIAQFADSMSLSEADMSNIAKNTAGYIPTTFNDELGNSAEKVITYLKQNTPRQTMQKLYDEHIKLLTVKSGLGDSHDGLSLVQFISKLNNATDVELSTLMRSVSTMSFNGMSDVGIMVKMFNDYGIEKDAAEAFTRFMIIQNGQNATKLGFVKALNLGPNATKWYGRIAADELSSIAPPKVRATKEFGIAMERIAKQSEVLAQAIINNGDEKFIQSLYSNIATTIKNTEGFYKEELINGKVVKTFNKEFMSQTLNRNTVLAYLFRPSTQVKNLLSNSVDYVVDATSNKFAKAVDFFAFGNGKRGVGRGIVGNIKFDSDAVAQADELMKTIDTLIFEFNNNVITRSKISESLGQDIVGELKDLKMLGIRDKTFLDKANKLLTFTMNAGDVPFRNLTELKAKTSIQMTNYYNSLVKEHGKEVGEKLYKNSSQDAFLKFIEENPLDDLDKAYIKQVGDYAVKTQDSGFKKFVNNIVGGFNERPVLTALKNATMPFTSWSSNSIDKTFDLLPGFNMLKESNRNILKKFLSGAEMTSLDKRYFSDMVGRQLSGVTLITLGMVAYGSGKLNVYDEYNADERNINQTLNIPNFSYKVGDSYIPLDFSEPGGWFVMLGASISSANKQYAKNKNYFKEIGAEDEASGYWATMSRAILSGVKSMTLGNSVFSQMSVFNDLIDGTSENNASKLISNSTRSLIPFSGLFTDMNKAADPVRRQTRLESDDGNIIRNATTDLLSNILPGYNKTLNYQYDISGAIKQRSQIGAITGVNALQQNNNPQAKEWMRLYKETGKSTVIPNPRLWVINSIKDAPDYKYTKAQQDMLTKINLDSDEYTKFSFIYGQMVKEYTKKVMENSAYNQYDDLQKAALIEKAVNRAGTMSLNYYKRQYYGISEDSKPISTK